MVAVGVVGVVSVGVGVVGVVAVAVGVTVGVVVSVGVGVAVVVAVGVVGVVSVGVGVGVVVSVGVGVAVVVAVVVVVVVVSGGMSRLSPKLQRWADEMAQAATSSPRENPSDTPYQKFLDRRRAEGESLDEALEATARHFGDDTRRVYFYLGSREERSAFVKLARELIRRGVAIDYDYYSKARVIGEGADPDFARPRGEILMADSETPIPKELLDRMAEEADLYFVDFYDDDRKGP